MSRRDGGGEEDDIVRQILMTGTDFDAGQGLIGLGLE
jgi:hypothetical protein